MSIPPIASVTKIGPSTTVSVTETIAQMQSQLNQLEQAEQGQSNVEARAQLEMAVEQVEEQLQQAQQAVQPKPPETIHSLSSAPALDLAPSSTASGTVVSAGESGPTLNALA